ncbi:hypothetical protein [Candidatus Gromoviella agglomerans]|uniref:hypothetical protein n=1 Tax=Candidatus Gromoviella agglomerans TaxID=2806609 RepID=UPI001E37E4FD|nr:hypothetical protein [Candidatus Gromoviella agglomerans]UFX98546.1 50S ribosomal protein L11 [Candidatus Gromoviella agglomerans]
MAVKKNIKAVLRLRLVTGTALTAVVAPRLGAHGANIPMFCKAFEERVAGYEKGIELPCVVTVYDDKSFVFDIKSPSVSFLIKEALTKKGVKNVVEEDVQVKKGAKKVATSKVSSADGPLKGARAPGKSVVGVLDLEDMENIFDKKKDDLNCYDRTGGFRIIAGSAMSMGVLLAPGILEGV